MNNYLIFRTDRIGDFLTSAILIKSIKRNDINCKITVIASKKNYFYIKNFNLVDEVILLPDSGILNKIKFASFLNNKKIYCIFVLDGKKRSLYYSSIIRSKIKIAIVTKTFLKIFFSRFFTKILLDDLTSGKINILKDVLNFLNYNFHENDLNTLETQSFKNPFNDKISSFLIKKNFILLHFDEKWIYQNYIKSYLKIQPTQSEFENFIFKIIDKSKKNLIITDGLQHNFLLDNFKFKFNMLDNNTYQINHGNNFVILFNNINFFDIQYLLFKSDLLISCHGAVTNVAAALNVKIFDIIDPSEDLLFQKYTAHFRNYTSFKRANFSILADNIISKLS